MKQSRMESVCASVTLMAIYSRGCDEITSSTNISGKLWHSTATTHLRWHLCFVINDSLISGTLGSFYHLVIEGNWHLTKADVCTRLSVCLVWIWTRYVAIMHTPDNWLFFIVLGFLVKWRHETVSGNTTAFVFPRPRWLLVVQVGTTAVESIDKSQFRHPFPERT